MEFTPIQGLLAQLSLLSITTSGPILHMRLQRPEKRNAINDTLISQIHTALVNLPAQTNAVLLSGAGDHFCAGLDLSELTESSTFYGLPEGQRGLFVGGGGSARIPRLIGFSRMTDMMLTGRVYDAAEGQAIGLSHYQVGKGEGLAKGIELAKKIAGNAPLSNFAVLQALPRIAEMSQSNGLFVESLIASITQGDDGAKTRMRAFLEGKAAKVGKS